MTVLSHPSSGVPTLARSDIDLFDAARVVSDQIGWWQSHGVTAREAAVALSMARGYQTSWREVGLSMMRWWMKNHLLPRNTQGCEPNRQRSRHAPAVKSASMEHASIH